MDKIEEKPNTRNVFSRYLNSPVEIIDDCKCTTGGYYEKEITEHYFRDSKSVGVKIYCDQCHKELSIIAKG